MHVTTVRALRGRVAHHALLHEKGHGSSTASSRRHPDAVRSTGTAALLRRS